MFSPRGSTHAQKENVSSFAVPDSPFVLRARASKGQIALFVPLCRIKVDTLREGCFVGKVDRARAPAHILFPSVTAGFTTPPGALIREERWCGWGLIAQGYHD